MNVEVTPEAEADLLEAVSGLRSAAAAEAVVDAFEKTLRTLREFPEVGQARGGAAMAASRAELDPHLPSSWIDGGHPQNSTGGRRALVVR